MAAAMAALALGCTEIQEPCMSQVNPPEVEMNEKAREEMMQKIKELEERIAEMEKGLTPLDPD
jgi:cytochrome c556